MGVDDRKPYQTKVRIILNQFRGKSGVEDSSENIGGSDIETLSPTRRACGGG